MQYLQNILNPFQVFVKRLSEYNEIIDLYKELFTLGSTHDYV